MEKLEAGRSRRAATKRMDVEPRDMAEMRSVVRGHMVRGLYLTSNFRDEQVAYTQTFFVYFAGLYCSSTVF